MNSRERDSRSKEPGEKCTLKHTRRESMQHKPNMCLDADGPEKFHSGELQTVTDEVTSVHPAYFELFSSFIFIFFGHSSVIKATVHASRMTRKLKEMSVREQNTAEEKEKQRKESALRDEAKPAQNACRGQLQIHRINSLNKHRPKFFLHLF
ncbi:hypothetical protein G5714_021005 [Onychostoma macrolepis]|uniref:Uncharacterized protein n=1 Tax=Onychostoma macrolepis TaxID=369639 RepID=A0A7J6BXA9_9TELE|nr:hypothetical protein G5714_021005 [Onychostoma macrolepis]